MAKVKLVTNPFNPCVGNPGLPRPALTWVETRTFPKDWDGVITCKFSEATRWDMICAIIKQVSGARRCLVRRLTLKLKLKLLRKLFTTSDLGHHFWFTRLYSRTKRFNRLSSRKISP